MIRMPEDDMNLKDKILSIARLEEVVGRYLPLQRGGFAKIILGLCPFHDDRHPSLHVNVKEQYYKCFACGEGGDLFKFVEKMEGCSFQEALKKLADWYGLSDEGDYRPVKYPPVAKKKQSVPGELVSPFHIKNLLRNHRMMLDWLEEYIPEEELLRETYKGFEVGIGPSSLPRDYSNFCNRLIFPIRNERGDPVAFAGRYRGETKGTDIHKYVNSSDSPVYHKSEILYGLYQAGEAIRQHGFVYVTEGYKDACDRFPEYGGIMRNCIDRTACFFALAVHPLCSDDARRRSRRTGERIQSGLLFIGKRFFSGTDPSGTGARSGFPVGNARRDRVCWLYKESDPLQPFGNLRS